MSATRDSTLTDSEQLIADLQRQLAECRAEREAALAREAAAAEILQVINSSPGDPGPVFEAILEKAHSLCGAAVGALVSYDGEHFRAVATHGYPEEFAAMLRRPYLPNVNHRRLLAGEPFTHNPDTAAAEPGPDHEIARGRRFAELTGVRTQLMMPLRRDGALLGLISAGVIALYRMRVEPFTERQIELVRTFADQAVCNRCWTRWPKRPPGFAAPISPGSRYARARSTAMWRAPRRGLRRTPSNGRSCASEPLSPVATASPAGWRSKAGSCMSRTSALIRSTHFPEMWRPGDAPCLGSRSCATAS